MVVLACTPPSVNGAAGHVWLRAVRGTKCLCGAIFLRAITVYGDAGSALYVIPPGVFYPIVES